MVEVQTYFDESGSHGGAHVLCVAGYIIEKNRAKALTNEWLGALKARDLPYFRMSECAHGNGPFAALTLTDRIQLVARLIQLIKQYTVRGIAVTIDPAEFDAAIPHHALLGRAYTFCANLVLAGVVTWLRTHPTVTDCAYFFEAGHASQAEANRLMEILFRNERMRAAHRYAGHAFVEKERNPAVQAADLLAWQWYTDKRHELEGRVRRKDCAKLLEHPHITFHFDTQKLERLRAALPLIFGAYDEITAQLRLYYGHEDEARR
jgi:hypothetical protein